ncbi:hypothetical protein, partial [Shewanella sp.]|uniref:hypothetical protein n=1 Tax=Shewanella sp. TaxID=50422 RepID=UPI00257A5D12
LGMNDMGRVKISEIIFLAKSFYLISITIISFFVSFMSTFVVYTFVFINLSHKFIVDFFVISASVKLSILQVSPGTTPEKVMLLLACGWIAAVKMIR